MSADVIFVTEKEESILTNLTSEVYRSLDLGDRKQTLPYSTVMTSLVSMFKLCSSYKVPRSANRIEIPVVILVRDKLRVEKCIT